MQDKIFWQLSEEMLLRLANLIENGDHNSVFEVEYADGILNIEIMATGQLYVINRHSASRKIWFSSPVSGADYFSYDQASSEWRNEKQQELKDKLTKELTKNFDYHE